MSATPTKYLVRYGAMRILGEFASAAGLVANRGDVAVVRTDRGLEAGDVLCPSTPTALSAIPEPVRGEFLRVATPDDHKKLASLADVKKKEFAAGERLVTHHKLAMQLVD